MPERSAYIVLPISTGFRLEIYINFGMNLVWLLSACNLKFHSSVVKVYDRARFRCELYYPCLLGCFYFFGGYIRNFNIY